jgi:hypothetical protein
MAKTSFMKKQVKTFAIMLTDTCHDKTGDCYFNGMAMSRLPPCPNFYSPYLVVVKQITMKGDRKIGIMPNF